MDTTGEPAVLLVAAGKEHPLPRFLEGLGYSIVQAPTGTLALQWAHDLRPDAIIVAAKLPDMSWVDACDSLRRDLRIDDKVPVLILVEQSPAPDHLVNALRSGAWDFLLYPGGEKELVFKLDTYIHAKRNIDVALAGGSDPTTGLHSRSGLARRARELGALLARTRGGLACVVFALDANPGSARAGMVLARSARISDVIGALGPTEFGVLAPATDEAGAVKLARRFAAALRDAAGDGGPLAGGATLRVGYDAVTNLMYRPIDPVELITRAASAARNGRPDPVYPWVRRYDATLTSRGFAESVEPGPAGELVLGPGEGAA
jgi:PleD family two-component response regulator